MKGNIAILKRSDTVYLLDASIYFFQAWFGYPDYFHDAGGRPVNGVYGYLKTLLTQLRQWQPRYLLAAFDESLFSGFRHQMYPDYKANRALPDEALAWQLNLCRQLTQQLGICCVGDTVYEGDDWLALGAQVARSADLPINVVTRDKDLAQLVKPGDLWWDWAAGDERDYAALCQHWEVRPQQIPDLLALMGDSADNIPGVAGIGARSARRLLQEFADLEALYGNLDAVVQLEVRGARSVYNALLARAEQALLFRELIRLHPPEQALRLEQLTWQPPSAASLIEFLDAQGLGAQFRNLVSQHYA